VSVSTTEAWEKELLEDPKVPLVHLYIRHLVTETLTESSCSLRSLSQRRNLDPNQTLYSDLRHPEFQHQDPS